MTATETLTADWYTRAAVELAAASGLQVEWALGVAGDPELLALIDELPRERRQPSLIFSAAGWCGAPAVGYPLWRAWVVAHWRAIAPVARVRRTQTNEVGRCIPLLVGLDRLRLDRVAGPIALVELGAAAGLCLGVDRYSYRFDDGQAIGAGRPLLGTTTSGTGVAPTRMPDIVWRAGIDLAPLDLRAAEDALWLEALLPPDRPDRVARLRAAIGTLAADPPRILAGDALRGLAALAAEAPAGATLVVASLGTAVYLPPADRAALPDAVAALGGRLVAFEPEAAIPGVSDRVAALTAPEPSPYVLSLDGIPLACAGPHGDRLSWLSESSQARPAGHPDLPGISP